MDLIRSAGFILLGIYAWWVTRAKVSNGKFRELETRMSKVESRSGCAQHGDFDKRIRQVQESVSEIKGRMEGIGRSLNIIQEYLMTKGK